MRPESYEGKVSGVWAAILSHHLPLIEGYVYRPEEKTKQRCTNITSVHWVMRPGSDRFRQCPFLITQCKRPGKEWKGGEWATAVGQLKEYLKNMQRRKSWGHSTYGIVAIGAWVKFFEWQRGLYQLGRDRPYHIIDDAEDVVRMLEHVKSNHE